MFYTNFPAVGRKSGLHRYLPIASLVWLAATSAATADSALRADDWRPDTSLSVSATTNYVVGDNKPASFQALAATLGVSLQVPESRVEGGLFASYRASQQEQADGMRSGGVYVNVDRGRWRNSNWLAAVSVQGGSGSWLAGSGIGYEFLRGGKLGLDLMTPMDDIGGLRVALAYSGSIGKYLAMNIAAGTDAGGNVDVTATLEWSWDIL